MPESKRPRLLLLRGGKSGDAKSPGFQTLSWPLALLVLLVALTWFTLGAGPIWKHPWEPNRSIVTSYMTIPAMVFVCLLVTRKLNIAGWLFDTLRIAIAKFIVTAFALVVMWAATNPKGAPMAPPPPMPLGTSSADAVAIPEDLPLKPPTPIDESQTASVDGAIVEPTGKPVQNAIVWISSGLESFDFAPPSEPMSIVNDGGGVAPVIVAQLGRLVEARSSDNRLHTMIGVDASGRMIFSVPVIAAGTPRPIRFTEALGLLRVHCGVHFERHTEHESLLLVTSHPFAATTGADGLFSFSRVPLTNPSEKLEISTMTVDDRHAAQTVELTARNVVHARIALP